MINYFATMIIAQELGMIKQIQNRRKGMKKAKLALIAMVAILCFACGNKTDVDFSIVPVKGANGEYQYIDLAQKGKIVINPQFSEAHYFRDGLALVKVSGEDGKWGYINREGKFAVAPTYSMAQHFSEDVAWVQIEDEPPMLIDKSGKMLLQIDSLTQTKLFAGGMSAISVYSQGQELVKFIDKEGVYATTIEGETIEPFLNDSLYAFKNNKTEKWGFRNINGEIVINPQFDSVNMFIDGMAVVKSGGKCGAIDNKGNFAINIQYDGLTYDSDGLFIMQIGKKYGWVNKENEMVINSQYDDAMGFYGSKLAPVKINNRWAYIDKKGQIAINPQFDEAFAFSGDYAMIKNDNKIGFINKKGDFVVTPFYEYENKYAKKYINAVVHKNYDNRFLPYAKLDEETKTEAIKENVETQNVNNILTDSRDGKKYKTVKIGTQVWMAENLNYNTNGSKCNDCKKYGKLYNWASAKNACPDGWHLPSDAEWDTLMIAVGGEKMAGKHLKAKYGWGNYDNSDGSLDSYGFTALPGGFNISSEEESFSDNVGFAGYLWSASEDLTNETYSWSMDFFREGAYYVKSCKTCLFSVRCIQDHSKNDKNSKIAVIQKNNNFQIGSSAEFLPYAKLNEKIEYYKEMENKKAEIEREALNAAIEKDPTPAIAELEEYAKKWQDHLQKNGKTDGRFFSFSVARVPSPCYECGFGYHEIWKAISKMKMSDCPAKSVWIMYVTADEGSSWGNKIPPKCKSVTPKIIAKYEGEETIDF